MRLGARLALHLVGQVRNVGERDNVIVQRDHEVGLWHQLKEEELGHRVSVHLASERLGVPQPCPRHRAALEQLVQVGVGGVDGAHAWRQQRRRRARVLREAALAREERKLQAVHGSCRRAPRFDLDHGGRHRREGGVAAGHVGERDVLGHVRVVGVWRVRWVGGVVRRIMATAVGAWRRRSGWASVK